MKQGISFLNLFPILLTEETELRIPQNGVWVWPTSEAPGNFYTNSENCAALRKLLLLNKSNHFSHKLESYLSRPFRVDFTLSEYADLPLADPADTLPASSAGRLQENHPLGAACSFYF